MFQNRFHGDRQAERVYQEFFSSYESGLVRLDSSVLNQIEKILEYKEKSKCIADEWGKVLFGNDGLSLESAHLQLPFQKLLESAMDAQFVFEEQQLRMKEVDQLLKLRHGRVAREIDLLQRAQGFRYYFLSADDRQYVDKIEERAKAVQQKKALLDALDERIAKARARVFNMPDLSKVFSDSRMAPWVPRVIEPDTLHPSLKDHCVMIKGNPILSDSAVFFILKRPAKMSTECWKSFISSENAGRVFQVLQKAKLDKVKPNQEFFPFIEEKYKDVAVCYEPVNHALQLHMERDVCVKTRRRVIGEGQFERTNRPEKDRIFADKWRDIWDQGWSENRIATAGPDCYEAIAVQRAMMKMILDGKMADLKSKTIQNLGEYFDDMPHSDVADLPGSYMQNPNFRQAFGLHQWIQDRARKICEKREALAGMDIAIETDYRLRDEQGRLNMLSQDLFESYENWRRKLDQFLIELENPANQELKTLLGPALIKNLRTFLGVLTEFVQNGPHPEIRGVLRDRRAILDAPLQPNRQALLDAVWTNWKQGKTKEEIEEILLATIKQVQRSIDLFNQGQIVISAPLTSPSFQGEIGKVMKPALAPIYQAAIPPFWQNKTKIEIVMKEILKGTDTSVLWLDAADTLGMAKSSVMKNELLRSRQAKLEQAAKA
ncbi:MAG: hypothetical protein K1X28_03880 [Parachlamydiales bacterium]|nr:hypothetical protein [Parachlamydiales bacterium]